METERVFRLEQRPQEFLPTSLNCIQFQHLHLICRPHGAVCRRCKIDIASGMPQLPDVKSRMPDLRSHPTKLFSLSSCPSLAGAEEGGRRPDEGRQGKIILQQGEGWGEESNSTQRRRERKAQLHQTPLCNHRPLRYPTQKPEALLERIIKTSSNPGD